MDRRIPFFAGSAVACFLLAPLAETFAWVAELTGAVYVLLTLLVALDAWSRSRRSPPPEGGLPEA